MRESLNEPVSVVFYYDAKTNHVQPYRLTWQNTDYQLGKIDFWHKTKIGDKLIHHFSIADTEGRMYFKLGFDTSNLHWVVEEFMAANEMTPHYGSFEGA